jgi:NAD-dependent dihydropyrimidine dehydrogenase PreA subunit
MADHVFTCYARKDESFVLKLALNLKQQGIRVWVDQWDIPYGADWDKAIDDALYDCAHFLIVLSPVAVDSREVRGEFLTALDENKPIVPVLYQRCRIPRQLRLIQYVDFTSRGPDDRTALGQALRALGVPEPAPTPAAQRRAPTPETTSWTIGLSEDSYVIDASKCNGCGECTEVCPTEAIRIAGGRAHIDSEDCIACGACESECRTGAIIEAT